jgi:hypothetical protein
MSKVVLDVSMSLDGYTAGPNVREEEPMGMAANAYTHGSSGKGRMARSPLPKKSTRPLAPPSSDGVRSISALVRGVARHGRVCPASWSPIG